MSGLIFLNYRRGDSAAAARHLNAIVKQLLPKAVVFMDAHGIEPGRDFREILKTKVATCDVLLAVIGRQWTTIADDHGNRRLDNPDDFVRMEIATALRRDIRVIPLLVDGAQLPREHELPDELKPLASRQAITLSHERFELEAAEIVNLIGRDIATKGAGNSIWSTLFGSRASQPPPPELNRNEAAMVEVLKKFQKTFATYIHPDIPFHKIQNLRASASIPESEPILALVDFTTFGSASDGIAVCQSGIYYNYDFASPYEKKAAISMQDFISQPVGGAGQIFELGGLTLKVNVGLQSDAAAVRNALAELKNVCIALEGTQA